MILNSVTPVTDRDAFFDRVSHVEGLGRPVIRPNGFDLASAWKLIAETFDKQWGCSVRALADPSIVVSLRWVFAAKLRVGPPAPDGRIEVEVGSVNERALVGQIAGFGAMVEVLEPPEIRAQLAAIGAQLAEVYGAPCI